MLTEGVPTKIIQCVGPSTCAMMFVCFRADPRGFCRYHRSGTGSHLPGAGQQCSDGRVLLVCRPFLGSSLFPKGFVQYRSSGDASSQQVRHCTSKISEQIQECFKHRRREGRREGRGPDSFHLDVSPRLHCSPLILVSPSEMSLSPQGRKLAARDNAHTALTHTSHPHLQASTHGKVKSQPAQV